MTVYDLIQNKKINEGSSNLGLSRKVKKDFSQKDSIENIEHFSSEQILSLIKNCIGESKDLYGIKIQTYPIPMKFRHYQEIGDAGIGLLVHHDIDNDNQVTLFIFGTQLNNTKIGCIVIQTIWNKTDSWNRSVERTLVSPKGIWPLLKNAKDIDEGVFMLLFDITSKEEVIDLQEKVGFSFGDLARGYYKFDTIDNFRNHILSAFGLFRQTIDAKVANMKVKQTLENDFQVC